MNKRIPQLLEAFARLRRAPPGCAPAARRRGGRALRPRPPARAARARRRRADPRGPRPRGAVLVADGRLRRLVNLRSPTMGETSGSVIRGALARQAAARLRRRLVLGAARRRRAQGPGRRVRDADDRGGARAAAEPAPSSARPRRAYVAREHDLDRVADAYAAALEEAAGGDAVAGRGAARGRRGGGRGRRRRPRRARRGVRARGGAGVSWRRPRERGAARPGARRRCRLALARPASSSSRSRSGRARPPDGRAVDHGRRDRLLRAGEELRGARPVPRPRRPRARLRLRLPGADRPAWRALRLGPDAYAAAKAINAVLMSLAAVPAYFLARRILRARLALLAARPHGRCAVDALHGHADDRERLLPALPRARAAARARRSSGRRRARQLALLALCGSPSRRAPRRSRWSPRPRPRRSCSASSSGAVCAGRCGRSPALRRSLGGRRRRRCSRPPRAAGRRWRCSAPTGPPASSYTASGDPPTSSSTTSPSSTSTSASSRSRRCSHVARARGGRPGGRARSPPRRSRSPSGCWLEVSVFASRATSTGSRSATCSTSRRSR